MIISGDVIKVTTEIEDRDIMGKLGLVKSTNSEGIWAIIDGEEIGLYKGEYITLEEEEAMIEWFTQFTGKEPKETKLDETLDKLERVEAELDQANDYILQLKEDLNNMGGNY